MNNDLTNALQEIDAGKTVERIEADGKGAGNDDADMGRTARDATSINPEKREPIDPSMPKMPPA